MYVVLVAPKLARWGPNPASPLMPSRAGPRADRPRLRRRRGGVAALAKANRKQCSRSDNCKKNLRKLNLIHQPTKLPLGRLLELPKPPSGRGGRALLWLLRAADDG